MPMAHLLNETVQVLPFTGYAGNGVRTFGAAVLERARIEWIDKQMRRGKDQSIRLVARIFLRPAATVAANDRITYDGSSYQVETVTRPRDVAARADHIEVMVSEEIA